MQCRYSEYELRSGGADITIDSSNCAAYVAAVADATLGSGIARQVCWSALYLAAASCSSSAHRGTLGPVTLSAY